MDRGDGTHCEVPSPSASWKGDADGRAGHRATDIADISELDDFDALLALHDDGLCGTPGGSSNGGLTQHTPRVDSHQAPRVPVYQHNFRTPVWSLAAMRHRHVVREGGERAERLMHELLQRSQRAIVAAERRAFDAASRAEEAETALERTKLGGHVTSGGLRDSHGHRCHLLAPLAERQRPSSAGARSFGDDEVVSLRCERASASAAGSEEVSSVVSSEGGASSGIEGSSSAAGGSGSEVSGAGASGKGGRDRGRPRRSKSARGARVSAPTRPSAPVLDAFGNVRPSWGITSMAARHRVSAGTGGGSRHGDDRPVGTGRNVLEGGLIDSPHHDENGQGLSAPWGHDLQTSVAVARRLADALIEIEDILQRVGPGEAVRRVAEVVAAANARKISRGLGS